MQLKKSRLRRTLGMVTANLFMATHGYAQQVVMQQSSGSFENFGTDSVANDAGSAALDSSVLFYQEQGGRVRAIEPVSRLTVTGDDGSAFTAKVIYDSLTGASPNGAAPWSGTQTFTTPAALPGQTMTVTGSSGNRTIVTIPGTGTVVAQYQTPPNTLPVDTGFVDRRYAFNLGYATRLDTDTDISLGLSGSTEHDYRSWSGNGALARRFNDHNTTLRLGINFEYDQSMPIFGTPTPLTQMNGLLKGPSDSKTVTSVIAGVTQVMNRFWLLQVNYDVGWNYGYQTDPYKIVSVVNPSTGAPAEYLYESRPRSRVRQSVYFANKIAIGPTAADISFRYYRDSWGIRSITSDLSERLPVTSRLYVEPGFHFYQQTAADFFRYYLPGGQTLPNYASADGRLARFKARTVGLTVGYDVAPNAEIYLMAEDYRQTGDSTVPNAPGDLATENFFSGVHAKSIVAGFTYRFQLSNE